MGEITFPTPHKIIGVAVIWNDQMQILIDRRRPGGYLGGFWEFPGGKIESGETIEDCIEREIREELGVAVEVGKHLIDVEYTYDHLQVTLVVHHCRYLSGVPLPIECDEVRWVKVEDLSQYPFPSANEQIIAALRQSSSKVD
ncbi:MAG: 8-oxo-dGTP diphosphatase MutT [Chroococcidiopsidaceae cyanobacterium CP_BM_ER_R8_30]|nr:8-oxo-dGTP diphosphatase MutT [Chroococcidiopsidaceae cyanobacterium CP_BM_ER_R8_30]